MVYIRFISVKNGGMVFFLPCLLLFLPSGFPFPVWCFLFPAWCFSFPGVFPSLGCFFLFPVSSCFFPVSTNSAQNMFCSAGRIPSIHICARFTVAPHCLKAFDAFQTNIFQIGDFTAQAL